jgi:alkylated DNA repair dioxygenase AlkB
MISKAYDVPQGLMHIKRAFTADELATVDVALAREGWLENEQAMRFSPLPDWLNAFAGRLCEIALETKFIDTHERDLFAFSQCIVNQYTPPGGLSAHVDLAAFGEVVVSLSLRSTIAMDFEPVDDARASPITTVRLDHGDLLFIRGDARRRFTHAIPARFEDVVDAVAVPRAHRVSLTLRTMHPDGHLLTTPASS